MASKLVLCAVVLAALAAVASARPRFLAIPLEDVQFVDGYPVIAPHYRTRRDVPKTEPETAADSSYGRSGGYNGANYGSDYVDYGAYTGGYGAFGWYTDHPVGGSYGSGYSGRR